MTTFKITIEVDRAVPATRGEMLEIVRKVKRWLTIAPWPVRIIKASIKKKS